RREVTVEIGSDAVRVSALDDAPLAEWRFTEISALPTPAGVLRIGLANGTNTARLEIRDQTLVAALRALAKPADRTGLTGYRTRVKVVAFSLAAIAILVGGAIWGMPLLADRVAPHLPVALEMRLGAAIDREVRRALDTSTDGKPFECGTGDASSA